MLRRLNGKGMKVEPECFPCFIRQAAFSLERAGAGAVSKKRVLGAVLEEMERADTEKSPAHATTLMHRRIRRMLGRDPFGEVKSRYNAIALRLYDGLKDTAERSAEPLLAAARLAIAGNIIDFGIFDTVDLPGAVDRALSDPLDVDHFGFFKEEVERAGEILYLLDNAGEAVLDRILIEELTGMGKKVTAVVKGGPVINDCTMEDARQAGIAEICEVIDNGSDAVGTVLESVSGEFLRRFRQSPLVISKGQGNFETLLAEEGNIFFLFQAKCEVVSRLLGLNTGAMLLLGAGGRFHGNRKAR